MNIADDAADLVTSTILVLFLVSAMLLLGRRFGRRRSEADHADGHRVGYWIIRKIEKDWETSRTPAKESFLRSVKGGTTTFLVLLAAPVVFIHVIIFRRVKS
jgi:hypothetical protein